MRNKTSAETVWSGWRFILLLSAPQTETDELLLCFASISPQTPLGPWVIPLIRPGQSLTQKRHRVLEPKSQIK